MGPRASTARGAGRLITLDTSAVVALLDRDDQDHQRLVAALERETHPKLIPVAILSEIAHFVERDLGTEVASAFLLDLDEGRFTADCGDEDFPRVAELVLRYDDLPLGVADGGVIACAERNGGRVLTLNRRHFDVVGRELGLEVLP